MPLLAMHGQTVNAHVKTLHMNVTVCYQMSWSALGDKEAHLGCFDCQLMTWKNWIELEKQVLAALAVRHSAGENGAADVAGSAPAGGLAAAESSEPSHLVRLERARHPLHPAAVLAESTAGQKRTVPQHVCPLVDL